MTNLKTFIAGNSYQERFIGDSNLICEIKIIKRTAKSVWFQKRNEPVKRALIKTYDGSEYIYTDGQYSFAPTCYAKRPY